MLDNSV